MLVSAYENRQGAGQVGSVTKDCFQLVHVPIPKPNEAKNSFILNELISYSGMIWT